MSSRSRRGPLKAIKAFFDDYSDLGVIAAILAIGLFAALAYVLVRPGDNSSTAKVELAASSTVSYPRFTVATTTTVDRGAATTTTNSAPRPPGPTAATSPRAGTSGKGTPRKSSSSPPVHHVLGPATSVKWASSPAIIVLKSGGHANGFVVVKNLSATAGTVSAPGCASGPRGATGLAIAPFTVAVKAVCAPAGKPTVVFGHRSHTWEWSWNATVDGRRASPPLAPGSYTFGIGGATVAVTVTP